MNSWVVWRKDTDRTIEYLRGYDVWTTARAKAKRFTYRGAKRLQTIASKAYLGMYREFENSPMFYALGAFNNESVSTGD